MAEYIEREALKDRMAGFVPLFIDESNRAYVDGFTDAYTLICQAPAADVVERKTGKWMNYLEDGFVECPFCHSATNCDGEVSELHYCFNCGAQMIGGDEDA